MRASTAELAFEGVPTKGFLRLTLLLPLAVFLLIGLGGLVNSTGSGLSVPDWPTTYGRHLFLYPLSEWKGGILYEHSHRLLAAVVGFLTFAAVLWSWLGITHPRYRWLRWGAAVAFLLVVLQGILGGLTVLLRLPTAVSVSHAMLAQSFFAVTLLLALGARPGWYEAPAVGSLAVLERASRIATIVWVMTFVQILAGALTRHTYSALAIPDFPLVFGGLFPSVLNDQVLLHYVHRVVGFALVAAVLWQAVVLWKLPVLRGWIVGSLVLVLLQILLGGWIVWSFRAVVPTTLHGIGGTALWAVQCIMAFQLWRWRRLQRPQP